MEGADVEDDELSELEREDLGLDVERDVDDAPEEEDEAASLVLDSGVEVDVVEERGGPTGPQVQSPFLVRS